MSTERITNGPRVRPRGGAHAKSTLDKNALTAPFTDNDTRRHPQQRPALSESYCGVSRTHVDPDIVRERGISTAEVGGAKTDGWDGRATNTAESTEPTGSPYTPLWFSLQKFPFHQLTSMMIPYSICPLLPNFPFAYCPTIFYPDLEAFLPRSEAVAAVRPDVSSVTSEEPSTAENPTSSRDTPPRTLPVWGSTALEPVLWGNQDSPGPILNEAGGKECTTVAERRCCRSFSGSWDAGAARNREGAVGDFPDRRSPMLLSTDAREYGNLHHLQGSGTKACKLSRSASENTYFMEKMSDELSNNGAGSSFQNKDAATTAGAGALHPQLNISQNRLSGEATSSAAGPTRALNLTTFNHLKSAASSLSLNKRLLLLLLVLPWAVTLAFYTYVPRRKRRQLQWLFPNVLVLIAFIITLAACLRCQFPIVVDLIVLTLQLCSWSVLAFLSPASADRSSCITVPYPGKCKSTSLAASAKKACPSDGPRDRGGSAGDPVLPPRQTARAQDDNDGRPAAFPGTKHSKLTPFLRAERGAASAVPPEEDSFPLPSSVAPLARKVHNEPNVQGQSFSAAVRLAVGGPSGAAGEQKTWKDGVLARADVGEAGEQQREVTRAGTADLPATKKMLGPASVRSLSTGEWTITAGETGETYSTDDAKDTAAARLELLASGQEDEQEEEDTGRAKQAQRGKTPAEREERTLLAETCDDGTQNLYGSSEQVMHDGEGKKQQQLNSTRNRLSPLNAARDPELQEVASKVSLTTASPRGRGDFSSVVESPTTEGEQQTEAAAANGKKAVLHRGFDVSASSVGNVQTSPFAAAGGGPVRAASLLLVDALGDVCAVSTVPDATAATRATHSARAEESDKEWQQGEEYLKLPVNTVERGAEKRGERIPARTEETCVVRLAAPSPALKQQSVLFLVESGRTEATAAADAEHSAITSTQTKAAMTAETAAEDVAVSPSVAASVRGAHAAAGFYFTLNEEGEFSPRNLYNFDQTGKPLETAAVDCRAVESERANLAGAAAPENFSSTKGAGRREASCTLQQKAQRASSYSFISKGPHVDALSASAKDVALPALAGTEERENFADAKRGENEGEGEEDRNSVVEDGVEPVNMGMATTGPQRTRAALGGEEEHSMGLGRQQEDVDESFCFWPSFIEEQNFSHPLQQKQQLSQYLDNTGAATHFDRSATPAASLITGADNLETAGGEELDADLQDCDFSAAEAFYFNLSSDELLGTTTEQSKPTGETNSELPQVTCLPDRKDSFLLYHTGEEVQREWGAGVAAAPAAVDRKLPLWQTGGLSAVTSVTGVAAGEGEARGPTASFVHSVQQTMKEALPLQPPVDDVCSPDTLSALRLAGASSVTHRGPQQERQEPQQSGAHQLLHAQRQHLVDSSLTSGFARSPLLGTENDLMWRVDASLTALRQRKLQGVMGSVVSCRACDKDFPHHLRSAPNAALQAAVGKAEDKNFFLVANAATPGATAMSTSNSIVVASTAATEVKQQSLEAVSAARFFSEREQAAAAAAAPVAGRSALSTTEAAARIPSVFADGRRLTLPEEATAAFAVGGGASMLEPAAAVERASSICEGTTVRMSEERAPTAGGAFFSPTVRVASRAEAAVKPRPLGGAEALADQAAVLTAAAPEMLSSLRKALVKKEDTGGTAAGGGKSAREDTLPPVHGIHASGLGKEGQQDATKEENNCLTRSPAPVAGYMSSRRTQEPVAAAAVPTSRAGRSSYNAGRGRGSGCTRGGGSTGRRATSAEARALMQHYMALVKDCYRSKDSHGALQVLELLQREKRVQPDTQLLNYILLVCVAAGSKDMTERLFNLMEKSGCADLVTYNTVLKSFVEAEDLASAEKLLHRMQKNPNISPDGVTFNLMINACVVCHQPEKAWDYIEKIKAAKLTVDVCEDVLLLSTCLDACARLGECGLLRNLLKYFEKSNLSLNAHAYGTVIKAYGRLGDMRRVWGLWQQQAEDKITPTSYTYGCMLDCLTTNNQVTAALEMFEEMIDAGVADAVHFSVLIKGLSKHRVEGARLAIAAYEMLKRSQSASWSGSGSKASRRNSSSTGRPSVSSSVVGGVNGSGSPSMSTASEEEAARVDTRRRCGAALLRTRKEEKKDLDRKEEDTLGTANSAAAAAAASAEDLDKAFPRQRRVVNCYLQALNTISYNALLHLCVSTGHLREALQFFEDMQQHPRAVPDLITYSSIIKGLCCSNVPQGLEVALQLFHNMQQRAHIKADAIIYNTLIQGAATRKRVQLVELLLQHMIDHGVPPSSYTLCQCVKLHGKCNNLARVLELHRELPARFNFEADEYVHTAMIAACSQNGAPLLAARIALDACAAGQQLSVSVLRKVLFDLQQRWQQAEEEVGCSPPEARRATVDHVLEEVKQLIWQRHTQELQQQQQHQQVARQSQQQPTRPPPRQQQQELPRRSQPKQQHTEELSDGQPATPPGASGACSNSSSSSRTARAGEWALDGTATAAPGQQEQHRQQELHQPPYRQQHYQRRQQELQQPYYRQLQSQYHQQRQQQLHQPHYRQQEQPQQKQPGQQQPQQCRPRVPAQQRLQHRLRQHEQQGFGYPYSGRRTYAGSHRNAAEKYAESQQQQARAAGAREGGGENFASGREKRNSVTTLGPEIARGAGTATRSGSTSRTEGAKSEAASLGQSVSNRNSQTTSNAAETEDTGQSTKCLFARRRRLQRNRAVADGRTFPRPTATAETSTPPALSTHQDPAPGSCCH